MKRLVRKLRATARWVVNPDEGGLGLFLFGLPLAAFGLGFAHTLFERGFLITGTLVSVMGLVGVTMLSLLPFIAPGEKEAKEILALKKMELLTVHSGEAHEEDANAIHLAFHSIRHTHFKNKEVTSVVYSQAFLLALWASDASVSLAAQNREIKELSGYARTSLDKVHLKEKQEIYDDLRSKFSDAKQTMKQMQEEIQSALHEAKHFTASDQGVLLADSYPGAIEQESKYVTLAKEKVATWESSVGYSSISINKAKQ